MNFEEQIIKLQLILKMGWKKNYMHVFKRANVMNRRGLYFLEPARKVIVIESIITKLNARHSRTESTMQILFPFKRVCLSFVTLRPCGVFSLRQMNQ